jgi:hypothetical protein
MREERNMNSRLDTDRAALAGVELTQAKMTARRTRRTWAEWLGRGTFDWEHFATLTLEYPAGEQALRGRFHTWLRRLEQRARQKVQWFVVIERRPAGLLHLHALVNGTRELATEELDAAWTFGRAAISRYNPVNGAAYYITKDIPHEIVDYDISPPPNASDTRLLKNGPGALLNG